MTRRQRVEEREQAIVAAARDVFIERGYDGARMAEIARRAGIAEGTVYIYFKTKVDLMRAIVADFWSDLTRGARQATRDHDETFAALKALADFHLSTLIRRFDVVALTQNLRVMRTDAESARQYLVTYVAVFDEIFRRGIDRGDLCTDTPIWAARDVFYGGLEYSARTLLTRGDPDDGSVVENMVQIFRSTYGQAPRSMNGKTMDEALIERLESAVEKLERKTAG